MAARSSNPTDPNYDPTYDPTQSRQATLSALGPADPTGTDVAPLSTTAQPLPGPSPTTMPPVAAAGRFTQDGTTDGSTQETTGTTTTDPYIDPETQTFTQRTPYQAKQNAQGQYLAPNGLPIRDMGDGTYRDDGGTIWRIGADGQPEVVAGGPYGTTGTTGPTTTGTTGTTTTTGTTGLPTGTNGYGAVTIPSNTSAYNQTLRDTMLAQLQGLEAPITATSSSIAPAIGAFDVQSQRDQQNLRDAMAERYYAAGQNGGSGLDSGAFNTSVQQGLEAGAQDRENFAGNTVMQANQQRMQQLQNMLQTATSAGLTDQAQQIQAQIQSLQMQLQNQQAGGQLGYLYNQLMASQNRDALLAALGGG